MSWRKVSRRSEQEIDVLGELAEGKYCNVEDIEQAESEQRK